MAKPENIMPIQKPVAPRSSAMVGNRGEIILNPNIAANVENKRVNNVPFSISLHQTLRYKKVSVKNHDSPNTKTAGEEIISL
jgi:hypothetical protein